MASNKAPQDSSLSFQQKLKQFTSARVAIGRAGGSLTTHELLKFQLEHAQARDAVHFPLDVSLLKTNLNNALTDHWQSIIANSCDTNSLAENRAMYLQRPDLGRTLNKQSTDVINQHKGEYDLVVCIVDGLSSLAIQKNTGPFLRALLDELKAESLNIAPLVSVQQGRVAIGDHIGQLLGAKMSLVLIGERPGLSSPDSLGLYLTYQPKVGCHDAMRNCISNIREGGLSFSEAAKKAFYLIKESNRLGFSGVDLKERAVSEQIEQSDDRNFLV